MRFIRTPNHIDLTFTDGYLSNVEQYQEVTQKTRKLRVIDVEFLYDMSKFFKTRRLKMFDLMQWIHHMNSVVDVEIVNTNTVKFNNIKL